MTVPYVMDVAISDYCCIFFDVSAFPVQKKGTRTIKKCPINNKKIGTSRKLHELFLLMASPTEDLVNNLKSKNMKYY